MNIVYDDIGVIALNSPPRRWATHGIQVNTTRIPLEAMNIDHKSDNMLGLVVNSAGVVWARSSAALVKFAMSAL